VPVLQQLEISYAVLVEWRQSQGRRREAARDVGPLALEALWMDLIALQFFNGKLCLGITGSKDGIGPGADRTFACRSLH
jgi:hypothetical protein